MSLEICDDVSGVDAGSSLPVFPGSPSKASHLLIKHFSGASISAAGKRAQVGKSSDTGRLFDF